MNNELLNIIFKFGKTPTEEITHNIYFEISEFEKELFQKDLERYGEQIKSDFYKESFEFNLGIFVGENSYKFIKIGIPLEVPGKLIICTDNNGLPLAASYNRLANFVSSKFGFEIIKNDENNEDNKSSK